MNEFSVVRSQQSVRSAGFTLVELLLSVAILGLLAGFAFPFSLRAVRQNDLELARVTVTQTLRMASARATAVDRDSPWGVHITQVAVTLFRGASFATRDPASDEVTNLLATITPSGLLDVTFSKLSGLPSATGTLTLTNSSGSATVTINAQGLVQS